MAQEVLTAKHVVVPHTLPQGVILRLDARHGLSAFLERYVAARAIRLNRPQVSLTAVRLVRGDCLNAEGLCRSVQQWRQLRGVRTLMRCGFSRSNDVGSVAGHEVQLDPTLLATHLTPFVIEPSTVGIRRKAGGIKAEAGFDGLQWPRAFLNEALQNRRQFIAFQPSEGAAIVRSHIYEALRLSIADVARGTPSGERAVGLEGERKDNIRQGNCGRPAA